MCASISTRHAVRFLCTDVMVLNDIIEQAAGRQSRASDHGGKYLNTHTHNDLPIGRLCIQYTSYLLLLFKRNDEEDEKQNARNSQTQICVLPFIPCIQLCCTYICSEKPL